MSKKYICFCLTLILVLMSILSQAQEKHLNRTISESLIADIDLSSWIEESFKVSPDSKHVAYAAKMGDKKFVVILYFDRWRFIAMGHTGNGVKYHSGKSQFDRMAGQSRRRRIGQIR